jgi:Mg2+/Co2+ transporter CorB
MVNHYIFDEDKFVEISEGYYEIDELRALPDGKMMRVRLTKEELTNQEILNLFYEENEKLHLLWEEYLKVNQERDKLLKLIEINKTHFDKINIPEEIIFGMDINSRLRSIIDGEEEDEEN